jgi:hypothetical protein
MVKISRFFKRTSVNLSILESGITFALETYAGVGYDGVRLKGELVATDTGVEIPNR